MTCNVFSITLKNTEQSWVKLFLLALANEGKRNLSFDSDSIRKTSGLNVLISLRKMIFELWDRHRF